MSNQESSCDLCQLPIEATGWQLVTSSGLKRFCCEGCLGIYRMLHEDELKAEPAASDDSSS